MGTSAHYVLLLRQHHACSTYHYPNFFSPSVTVVLFYVHLLMIRMPILCTQVLPVFQHQFSSKQSLAPFQTRVNLCQLAFESCSSDACTVRVLTLEEDVECLFKRHGTIDTLHYIKEHCPQAHLHLILGSDTYHDIAMGKWKQGAEYVNMKHFCLK